MVVHRAAGAWPKGRKVVQNKAALGRRAKEARWGPRCAEPLGCRSLEAASSGPAEGGTSAVTPMLASWNARLRPGVGNLPVSEISSVNVKKVLNE